MPYAQGRFDVLDARGEASVCEGGATDTASRQRLVGRSRPSSLAILVCAHTSGCRGMLLPRADWVNRIGEVRSVDQERSSKGNLVRRSRSVATI
jgi:hypothetical protein